MIVYQDQSGFSLLESLLALGLAIGTAYLLSSSSVKANRSLKLTSNDVELAMIQYVVINDFDCSASLGVGSGTNFPLNCSDYSTIGVLKRKDGTALNPGGKIGNWTVSASCNNGEVLIKASQSGVNPLTKTPYDQAPEANDVFAGTSELCRYHFESKLGESKSGTDLDCFIASRSPTRFWVSDKRYEGFAKQHYKSKNSWGSTCVAPYSRISCSINTRLTGNLKGGTSGDADITPIENGCSSDDDEWNQEHILYTYCCRLNR